MHQRPSAAPGSENPACSFAGFRLEADGTLLRGETPVHLPPKELAALQLLIANAGRIVTPLELRRALWDDVHVSSDSIPKCVSSLRARLEPAECIQTIYKRGYRFSAEVRMLGAGPGGALRRLAILPFATGFGVPEHLGSVVAEETMARLSGARPAVVNVLAQDSVFTLSRRGLTAQQTGEALNADLVLAGALSAMPMHYRIRVEMIRVEDGVQIWVEDLLVERSLIAGLETELAKRVAFRLAAPGSEVRPWIVSRSTVAAGLTAPSAGYAEEGLSIAAVATTEQEGAPEHREAYEIFQRAHNEWQTLQRHRMQDGLQHLLRATELDPSLIGARIDLVNLCVTQCFYGFMSPMVEADIVRRATESIPELPERAEAVLPALGWISFHFHHNLVEALNMMSLSAQLPHDPWVTRVRSMLALSRHRFSEAIDLLRGAIHLDPYAPWLQARLAWALHLAGESAESLEQIQRVLRLFSGHEGASLYGAAILAHNGEAARATELARELTQRLPDFDLATSVHAYALACAGRADEARATLERLQWLSRERFLMKAFMPAAYVALGEPEAALAELRAAEETRCPWFFQMLADPRLKPLAGQFEFERMGAILADMEAEAARDSELMP